MPNLRPCAGDVYNCLRPSRSCRALQGLRPPGTARRRVRRQENRLQVVEKLPAQRGWGQFATAPSITSPLARAAASGARGRPRQSGPRLEISASKPSIRRSALRQNSNARSSARHRRGLLDAVDGASARRGSVRAGAPARSARVAATGVGELAVRTGADAEVVAEAPVVQVVPALRAAPRIGRDFVLLEPRGGEPRLASDLHREGHLVVGQARRPTLERRAGLQRQLVMRNVRGLECERLLQVRQRVVQRLLAATRTSGRD